MKKYSLWLEKIQSKSEPILKDDICCDILIVGAGMTGVSIAYQLRNHNLNIVVVDKNQVGHGISARTTGKLTYLQETVYSNLKKMYSKKKAKDYLNSQLDAIKLVKDIIHEHHIHCDLQKVASYVFSSEKAQEQNMIDEKNLLIEFGIPVKEMRMDGKYIIGVEDTYVFHPIKYIQSLKEICKQDGVKFYEHTDINFLKKENESYICGNELACIRAKKVVFACHYPYFLFPFLMPLKCTIEKSYISACMVEQAKKYSAISAGKPTISVRYYRDEKQKYKLYLSDSHPLYKEYDSKKHFGHVIEKVKKYGLKPKYIWSNHDIMTFDHLPLIGRLEKGNPQLFLATGYNTWGMTNSNLAGKMISDMILDIYNPYQELCSPLRSLKLGTLPETIYSGLKPMIENKVWKNKKWDPNNVYFETRNGKNVAIYVDKFKKEHIVYNTCPHLKCSLLFNSVEKTWDCPCHGSRFDLDGHVIIGPSNYNIVYHEHS